MHLHEQRPKAADVATLLFRAPATATMPVQSRLANLSAHLQASTVNVGGKEWEVSHVSGVTTYRCAASSGAVVAMLGAGGGIGQPISMLLQLSPLVGELRLYDVVRTLGVGADLGHIDSDVRSQRPPPRRAPCAACTHTGLSHPPVAIVVCGECNRPAPPRKCRSSLALMLMRCAEMHSPSSSPTRAWTRSTCTPPSTAAISSP